MLKSYVVVVVVAHSFLVSAPVPNLLVPLGSGFAWAWLGDWDWIWGWGLGLGLDNITQVDEMRCS